MADEGLHIVIDQRGAQDVESRLAAMEKRLGGVSRGAKDAGRSASQMSSSMRGDLGRVAAMIGGGIGLQKVITDTLEWKRSLGRLQVEARLSNTEIASIESKVLAISSSSGIAAEEFKGALDVFQNFGGILGSGVDQLKEMAMLTKATGAPLADLATISATLVNNFKMSKEEVLASFAAMRSAAIAGSLPMSKSSQEVPMLLGMAKGMSGKNAVQQMMSAYQLAATVVGPRTEESRTAVLGLIRNLDQKAAALKKVFKIDVYDKSGTMKNLDETMLEIMRKTKGDVRMMSRIFSDEGLKSATSFLNSYDKATGNWGKGSKVESIFGAAKGGNIEDLYADARRATTGIASDAARVGRALNELELTSKKAGGAMLAWTMENKGQAAIYAAGVVGLRGFVAQLSSGSAVMGKVFSWMGGVGAAAAVGVAAGTVVANKTGIPDLAADMMFRLTDPQEWTRRKTAEMQQAIDTMRADGKRKTGAVADVEKQIPIYATRIARAGTARQQAGLQSNAEETISTRLKAVGLGDPEIKILLRRVAEAVEKEKGNWPGPVPQVGRGAKK